MASGEALLEKMRRAPHGNTPGDIERLLSHFGFKKQEGANHSIFRHDALPPGEVVTVPRHRPVRAYVARRAVKAVDSIRNPLSTEEDE